MSVFVAVAEEQGFASAARRLGLSPPAVTRAVAALERHLGVKLLNRTTRYVRTSEAGQRYLADARRVLAAADAIDAAVSGANATPRGLLTVTAPVMFGRMFVMPGIVEYLQTFPDIEFSALFLDRDVNLLEEGVDVAVRIGDLPDSSLRALPVGTVRQVVCAAPEYLRKHAAPSSPEDLARHCLIASSAAGVSLNWRFGSDRGERSPRLKPRLTVTSNDAAIEAALRGFGITRLLSYQVARHVAAGKLRLLLEPFEPAAWPIHVVHHQGRLASATVRSFIDFIAAKMRADEMLN